MWVRLERFERIVVQSLGDAAMRYTRYLLLALALAVLPITALAEETVDMTVQGLYNNCRDEAAARRTFCQGYLFGVADVLSSVRDIVPDARDQNGIPFGICDSRYSVGSLVQIFINWAEKNPDTWRGYLLVGPMLSFTETWPCWRK